jgi:hypothetical protein
MLHLLKAGVAPAEAAAAVVSNFGPAAPAAKPRARPSHVVRRIELAVIELNEQKLHRALDSLLPTASIDHVVGEVVIPFFSATLPHGLQQGTMCVAHAKFAVSIIRGRLMDLARGWGKGSGPLVLLAAPPDEPWDIAMICLGLCLRERVWRELYLGPRLSIVSIIDAVQLAQPAVVALTSTMAAHFEAVSFDLQSLAERVPVALAGPGATKPFAEAVGATLLRGNPAAAADTLTDQQHLRPRRRHRTRHS